jgi:hypothetical protein
LAEKWISFEAQQNRPKFPVVYEYVGHFYGNSIEEELSSTSGILTENLHLHI